MSKNEWLGDVINPAIIEVEAYVLQIDMHLLHPGQEGYFYSDDMSREKVPVVLTLIEPLNPKQLSCQFSTKLTQHKAKRAIVETPCYHSSEFGGEIATFMTEKGEYVPVDSVIEPYFMLRKSCVNHIERGHVIVITKAQSFAYRFFYHLKRILIQESDF